MSEALKRQFYTACPVWYWPVLWWNLLVMERYLAHLYAVSGRTEMTYGLALGPHGQLRLVFLSDAARGIAPYTRNPAMAYEQALIHPPAEYLHFSTFAANSPAPTPATFPAFPLYLDPG